MPKLVPASWRLQKKPGREISDTLRRSPRIDISCTESRLSIIKPKTPGKKSIPPLRVALTKPALLQEPEAASGQGETRQLTTICCLRYGRQRLRAVRCVEG